MTRTLESRIDRRKSRSANSWPTRTHAPCHPVLRPDLWSQLVVVGADRFTEGGRHISSWPFAW